MSRGPGLRQREILDRLREIRHPRYPALWHRLHGDPSKPWPDPTYRGHGGSDTGQPLCLYSTDSDRAVQVSFRRAANALAARDLLEIQRQRDYQSDILYARLPLTDAERIAVNGLRRQYRDKRTRRGLLIRQRHALGTPLPSGLEARALLAKLDELNKWIWQFEYIDRGPDSNENETWRSSSWGADRTDR